MTTWWMAFLSGWSQDDFSFMEGLLSIASASREIKRERKILEEETLGGAPPHPGRSELIERGTAALTCVASGYVGVWSRSAQCPSFWSPTLWAFLGVSVCQEGVLYLGGRRAWVESCLSQELKNLKCQISLWLPSQLSGTTGRHGGFVGISR